MKSQGPWGLCVEVKSLKTYMNQSEDPEAPKIARLVLAEGARAGFAVDVNGGIVEIQLPPFLGQSGGHAQRQRRQQGQ